MVYDFEKNKSVSLPHTIQKQNSKQNKGLNVKSKTKKTKVKEIKNKRVRRKRRQHFL